jgi:hypothetical protein
MYCSRKWNSRSPHGSGRNYISPRTPYAFQVALGGSTGSWDWRDAVQHMSM